MRKFACLALATVALSGCSYLFPEDWREGEEPLEMCTARLGNDMALLGFRNIEDKSANLVPTYTYDITKMEFSAMQALIVPGADETLGSRLMKQNNEISTARARFMESPVDGKGAFFLGQKPNLWRVRGDNLAYGEIVEAGCKRQQAGMRLIRVDVATGSPGPDAQAEPSQPLDNNQTGGTTR